MISKNLKNKSPPFKKIVKIIKKIVQTLGY